MPQSISENSKAEMPSPRHPPRWVFAAAAAWLSALVLTTVAISGYTSTPGKSSGSPTIWPANTHLVFDRNRPLLLMFIHPQCPCTLASLEELKTLMTDVHRGLSVQLVFVRPQGMAEDSIHGRSWNQAASIPGASTIIDDGGVEADRFGAATSGDVRLYDTHGILQFAGGITLSRGHAGDNPGRDAIEAILAHQLPARVSTPVFGCPLSGGCNQGATTCPVR